MGTMRIRHFTSSICCTLHSFQGSADRPSSFMSPSHTIAALFKNLQRSTNRSHLMENANSIACSEGGFLPELECQGKLHHHGALPSMVAVQQRLLFHRIVWCRQSKLALSERGDEDLHDAGEDTALRRHEHVKPDPGEEEDDGEEHQRRWDAKPQRPADTVLDVDDGCHGHHRCGGRDGVVPVEKTVEAAPPLLCAAIKLVDAER